MQELKDELATLRANLQKAQETGRVDRAHLLKQMIANTEADLREVLAFP